MGNNKDPHSTVAKLFLFSSEKKKKNF